MKFMRLSFALAWLAVWLGSSAFAQADAAAVDSPDAQSSSSSNATLPVTTSSVAAARYFETGMVHFENHRWNFALRDWRAAVELDPNFALAYTWICFTTVDPAEESAARAKAKAAMSSASPPEQLMVKWITGVHENNYVAGIQAMNDLVAAYPRDKRLKVVRATWDQLPGYYLFVNHKRAIVVAPLFLPGNPEKTKAGAASNGGIEATPVNMLGFESSDNWTVWLVTEVCKQLREELRSREKIESGSTR